MGCILVHAFSLITKLEYEFPFQELVPSSQVFTFFHVRLNYICLEWQT